jgi:hypothetical protein
MTHPLDLALDQVVPRVNMAPDLATLALWVGDACCRPSAGVLLEVVDRCAGWMANLDIADPKEAMREEYDLACLKHAGMTLDAEGPTDEQRVAALVEELGEVARALTYDKDHAGDLTTELTQLAALAAAWATRLVGLSEAWVPLSARRAVRDAIAATEPKSGRDLAELQADAAIRAMSRRSLSFAGSAKNTITEPLTDSGGLEDDRA